MKRLITAIFAALPLLATALPHTARAATRYTVVARVTRYVESGYTYGGWYTTLGLTAGCSPNLSLGTWLLMSDGRTLQCQDRGVDDGVTRVDIYDPYGVIDLYPDWDYVEVLGGGG